MTNFDFVRELRRKAETARRKGDALRTRDSERALAEYRQGVEYLDEALTELVIRVPGTEPESVDLLPPAETEKETWVEESVEVLGSRGGLLRRLDEAYAALSSYRAGASLEELHDLASTYNRANYVKLSLINKTNELNELEGRITRMRDHVARRLASDERAADDAWLWADYGDTLLMLGEIDDAADAYRRFRSKAETGSSRVTLSVLHDIRNALLRKPQDPAAQRFNEALDAVEPVLEVS